MKTIVICAGGPEQEIVSNDFLLSFSDAFFIGTDHGTMYLLNRGIVPDMAVGDFDSITNEEWQEISERVPHIERYSPEKNETDTELAIIKALSLEPTTIYLTGVTGGRLDHYEANLHTVYRLQLAYPQLHIKIVNRSNELQFLLPGEHTMVQDDHYKYMSFFAFKGPVENMTLRGVLYETTNEVIEVGTSRFTSNEISDGIASISFTAGICLMIRSKDD
ncbi:thiamine diphosphokinase [Viridibacillus arvi]|jgi:thiamine pyrophosphokinase|uniref:Thiamine diphosphokinase n=1 Tax=Viridibacillus arvi TaxID=263475 RepID=A0A0M0LE05_9BACL|nr:thiamine diphosphokinase [Viridibacillus arvi]KOO49325.1 thiamine pyrophosphokinase [Viridibacillus arvi]